MKEFIDTIAIMLLFLCKQFNFVVVILLHSSLQNFPKDYSLGIYAINTPIPFSETTPTGALTVVIKL